MRREDMDWRDIPRKIEDLKEEVKYGLPSKKMIEKPSVIAFKMAEELVVVKCRFTDEQLEEINKRNLYTYYDEVQQMYHHYNELLHKNVIYDWKLLSNRGRTALNELYELLYC